MSRSRTTTEPRRSRKLDPIPPGEILWEELMKPLGIGQNRLARDLSVPPARVNDIVHGRRAITADTALRLGKYFGTSAELWLGLQLEYDLRRARRDSWSDIDSTVQPVNAA